MTKGVSDSMTCPRTTNEPSAGHAALWCDTQEPQATWEDAESAKVRRESRTLRSKQNVARAGPPEAGRCEPARHCGGGRFGGGPFILGPPILGPPGGGP